MIKKDWKKLICDKCKERLDNSLDLMIWNDEDGEITELSFRHGCGRGCDDRSFKLSRHVNDYLTDILEKWGKSSYNIKNRKE
jgi:RNase P subunit RPR2